MNKLDIPAILPYLVKSPIVFSLTIPQLLIYCSTKFANTATSSQIFFVTISVSALIFSAWVIKQFIANGIDR